MGKSAKKHDSEFRSRLAQAAEESKSPVKPTIGIWRAIVEVFHGPDRGAVANERHDQAEHHTRGAKEQK